MGVAFDDPSTGVDGPADAQRRIRELQRTVANFRERGVFVDGPDLVVQSATVSATTLSPGQSFTFSATVRNDGRRTSPSTTLRYGRREGSSGNFTEVGTAPGRGALAVGNQPGVDRPDGSEPSRILPVRRVRGRGQRRDQHRQQLLAHFVGDGDGRRELHRQLGGALTGSLSITSAWTTACSSAHYAGWYAPLLQLQRAA